MNDSVSSRRGFACSSEHEPDGGKARCAPRLPGALASGPRRRVVEQDPADAAKGRERGGAIAGAIRC